MPKTKANKTEQETTPVVDVVGTETSLIKLELNKLSALKKEFGDDDKKIAFVKTMVNKDLTDVELLVFLSFANKIGLNPFLGEILAIVYSKDDASRRRVNYIVPRSGKRIVATRTGGLDSLKTEAIYVTSEGVRTDPWNTQGKLWGATCTVIRNGVAFEITVPLTEYNTGKDVWSSKPSTMIKKVAESQALSAAYPELLGATYDDAEVESMSNGFAKKELAVPNGDEPAKPAQIDALLEQGYTQEQLEGITRQQAVGLLTSKPKAKKVEGEVAHE